MRWRVRVGVAVVLSAVVARQASAQEQALGHKILGTIGLNAGTQPDAGVYALERLVFYFANDLIDKHGNRIPIGLDIDAFAVAVGASATLYVSQLRTYLNASFGVPGAYLSVSTERPEASVDRYGLADVYVQPLRLGWRLPHVDVVAGYAFYAPTGGPGTGGHDGVGRGHWTHELSAGGTLFFDQQRTWQLSSLVSYELNQRKESIDITRGDTIQLQGGVGGRLLKIMELGATAYALWQVRDDRGSDLPPALRGAHDQAFGLGAELGVLVPWIRSRLTVRYAHDLIVTSRPKGQIVLLGFTVNAWRF